MSADIVEERVPTYLRRVGDHVMQGSNSSVMVLGTDRARAGVAGLDAGLGHTGARGGGKSAGAVHLIAGMSDPAGNPDFISDRSYIYMSMKSDIDDALGTSAEEKSSSVSAVAVKSDTVRLVARKDVKVVVDGSESYVRLSKDACTIKVEGVAFITVQKGKVIIDADNVQLGAGATERLIKGDTFMNQVFNTHIHGTGVGPSGPPSPRMTPEHLSSRTVMVK